MIKTHTAQSLGKYIGIKAKWVNPKIILPAYPKEVIGEITSIVVDFDFQFVEIDGKWSQPCDEVYPILKPYEKLLEPMIHEGKQIIPIKYIYLQLYYTVSKECWESIRISDSGIWSIDGCLVAPDFQMLITMVSSTPQIIERLIELGFGAIKDESSPTGYRDLFGYVCEVER